MTHIFPSNCGPYRIQRLKTHGPIVLRGQVVFIKIPRGAVASTLRKCVRTRFSNFHYFLFKQLKLLLFPDIFRAHFKVGTILANFARKLTSDINVQMFQPSYARAI